MRSVKPKTHSLKKLAEEESVTYRPSEFMRGRRPHLFSDSITNNVPRVPKEVFEFHLETLTSRKQETEFEHFARKLVEKEICPNLIPQTGPTGGGDSKVDTETYPVSDQIALRWYVGSGNEASQERWAFAISAKKTWRSKIASDVDKIVSTKRDYKLIYFITNQYVKDKSRASVEDALTKKHGINVRILDRTWIVKCIYEHDRLPLAIESLNITDFRDLPTKSFGPKDAQRLQELNQLEQQIDDTSRYQGVTYQLAEDCLHAALLARGLEMPRIDVEGRFDRAERVSQKVNHKQQQLRIAYNRAWTVHWWYDDFTTFVPLYDRVENLAMSSSQANDLEMLANLWQLLYTAVRRKVLDATAIKLQERTDKLKSELRRLASDSSRPNNSMNAQANLLLVEWTEAVGASLDLKPTLSALNELLLKSEGLPEFSAQTIIEIIRELGEFRTDDAEYDKLFETIVRITEKRSSQGEAGVALYERGLQKLKANKAYDAIRLLGRAQKKLALYEYRKEWVSSIALCGLAYEAAGLLWAARANIVAAANLAFSEYFQNGKFIPPALRYVQKLLWLELQLGRVPHVLAAREVASLIASAMSLGTEEKNAFDKEQQTQDMVLSMLFLKGSLGDIQRLDFLPDVLIEQGLFMSRCALLYALGYEDHLRGEGTIPSDQSPEAVRDLYRRLLEQPAIDDIPEKPNLLLEERVTLRSFILGCEVTVEAANNDTSLTLAETTLGALEALLATCLDVPVMPYRSELTIHVFPSDHHVGPPELQVDEKTAGEDLTIRHGKDIFNQGAEERKAFHDWLGEFVIETAFKIIVTPDPDNFVNSIIRDEQGMDRAIDFADIHIAMSNIFGATPKFRLEEWKPKGEMQKFPLRRDEQWDFGLEKPIQENHEKGPLKISEGEPPQELLGIDKLKHKDQRIVSLINIPLWDKAIWKAIAYMQMPQTLPIMALGFGNAQAAIGIFHGLKKRLGDVDTDELMRVSIITGVDKAHPSYYRVVISTNLESRAIPNSNYFVLISRVQNMEPPDLTNLNNFLDSYKRAGKYVILPAFFLSEKSFPEPLWDFGIVKTQLSVRSAWEIGRNDPDVVAIHEGDDPIIPEKVKDAPVVQALQRFKTPRRQRRHKATRKI
jgi:hypothetical protein